MLIPGLFGISVLYKGVNHGSLRVEMRLTCLHVRPTDSSNCVMLNYDSV